jgi:hypothetical protein
MQMKEKGQGFALSLFIYMKESRLKVIIKVK